MYWMADSCFGYSSYESGCLAVVPTLSLPPSCLVAPSTRGLTLSLRRLLSVVSSAPEFNHNFATKSSIRNDAGWVTGSVVFLHDSPFGGGVRPICDTFDAFWSLSSSLAAVLQCTSSGPSAIRRNRAPAKAANNGVSWLNPIAPKLCMQSSTICPTVAGTRAFTMESICLGGSSHPPPVLSARQHKREKHPHAHTNNYRCA